MMDTNKNILHDIFTSLLTDDMNGLDLEEVIHRVWGAEEQNTFIDGYRPIDEVWASTCLEIGGFKLLSFRGIFGDHRTMIFDVTTCSLIGNFEHRVVMAGCRRLNCKASSMKKYIKLLEKLMAENRMDDRVNEVLVEIVDNKPTPSQRR